MPASPVLRDSMGIRRMGMEGSSPTVWHLQNNTMWPLWAQDTLAARRRWRLRAWGCGPLCLR